MVCYETNFSFPTGLPKRYNCPWLMDFNSQGQHFYYNSGWLKTPHSVCRCVYCLFGWGGHWCVWQIICIFNINIIYINITNIITKSNLILLVISNYYYYTTFRRYKINKHVMVLDFLKKFWDWFLCTAADKVKEAPLNSCCIENKNRVVDISQNWVHLMVPLFTQTTKPVSLCD